MKKNKWKKIESKLERKGMENGDDEEMEGRGKVDEIVSIEEEKIGKKDESRFNEKEDKK